MNSRERVRCALNFQEPGRVPIDISGMRSTGIAAVAYARLKAACGLDILNPIQTSAANMEPERLRREFGGRIVFWVAVIRRRCWARRLRRKSTPTCANASRSSHRAEDSLRRPCIMFRQTCRQKISSHVMTRRGSGGGTRLPGDRCQRTILSLSLSLSLTLIY